MSEDNFAIDIEPSDIAAETADSPEMEAAFEEGLNSDVTPQPEEQPSKYKIDDQEYTMDELRDLTQKGMNIPKLESKIQAIDQKFGGLAAMAEQQGVGLDDFINQIQYNAEEMQVRQMAQEYDISEEDARRYLDDSGFFEGRKQREAQQQQQQANDEMLVDFLNYFEKSQGHRFDAEKDQIPAEVWQEVENGTPLRYAYLQHERNQLLQEIENIKNPSSSRPVKRESNNENDAFLKGFNSI
ncbi:MAG: hypothetical protein Q8934_19720 [Bacillota bacterium]|nr:hypothetical protein [Bacillota bacterium]